MITRMRIFPLMLVGFAGVCPRGQFARANTSDLPTALSKLSASREEYETKMEQIRGEIVAEFDRLKTADFARRDGKPKTSNLDAAREEFTDRGVLPNSAEFGRLAGKAQSARDRLLTAYRTLRKAAVKAGDKGRAIATQLEAEIGQLEAENDLIPWKSLPLELHGNHEIGKTRVDLSVIPAGPYRLQIGLTRSGESGAPKLEAPLPDDGRIEFSATSAEASEITLMVAIRQGMAAPELGFPRPLESRATANSDARTLAIWSDVGALKVKDVKYKPIVVGDPVTKVTKASKPPKRSNSNNQTACDLAPVGSVWRGTVSHSTRGSFNTRGEVVKSGNGLIAMKADWLDGHAVELLFATKGTSLTLKDVRNLGGSAATRAGLRGAGQVKGGRLTSSFFWIVSSGALRNQQVSGSIALEREP